MKKYIALLRGINVSGKNCIKMDALKQLFLNLEFERVQTYIQSGNVIFASKKQTDRFKLAEIISNQIEETFQLKISVLVLEDIALQHIVSQVPFAVTDDKNTYISFFNEGLKVDVTDKITQKKAENELLHFTNEAVYLYCPDGYGKTKITNNFLEKMLQIFCTTRNLNTSKKLLELVDAL